MSQFAKTLDREWATVVSSPAGRRALIRWRAFDPAFADLVDLDAVLEARLDVARGSEVLASLARLSPDDEVAARTLLQALLPGLIRLASRVVKFDRTALEEMVSLAWVRIRTYPPTRHGSIPTNILRDVRKGWVAHRHIEIPNDGDGLEVLADVTDGVNRPESEVLAKLLLDDMVATERAGMITKESLDSIVRTRLLCDPIQEVADDTRLPRRVFRQRRWRAERVLRSLALAG